MIKLGSLRITTVNNGWVVEATDAGTEQYYRAVCGGTWAFTDVRELAKFLVANLKTLEHMEEEK